MTNDYIFLEEEPAKQGRGGSFMAKVNFRLDNFTMPFYRVPVKIDSGCSVSTIPIGKINVPEKKTLLFYSIPEKISG